jgi:hypothetical protein
MSNIKLGFEYTIEHVRGGEVISTETATNLVPIQGLDYIVAGALTGGSTNNAWYIGLYEGNYVPTSAVTAATVVAVATECLAYANSTRPAWIAGPVTAGSVDNSASRAEFVMNATKTVYGGFLISSNTKSGGDGTLISIVRFPTAKSLESGDTLRVTAGITTVSA